MKKFLLTFLIACVGLVAHAKLITIHGVYQGKSLFIQNPYDEKSKEYCVTYVYVNGEKVVSHPHTSAFEVVFDSMAIGAKLEIKIYGHQECINSVKLLNPTAIKSDAMFSFVSLKATKNTLVWRAKGETPKGYYLVKYYLNREWVTVKKVEAKHELTEDNYSVKVITYPGQNKFKVVFVEGDGTEIESPEREVLVDGTPVKFYPGKVEDKISFSPSIKVNYKIVNIDGEVVKKGYGAFIDCSGLEKKKYYTLYYNNRKGRFFKKR